MESTRAEELARARIAVLGAAGQLGSELAALLEVASLAAGWQGLTRAECDITDLHRVRAVIVDQARAARDAQARLVVINAGAYTNVDGAESDETLAYAVNASGPAHIALACSQVNAQLVQVSTDYVFSGDRTDGAPYAAADPTGSRSIRQRRARICR